MSPKVVPDWASKIVFLFFSLDKRTAYVKVRYYLHRYANASTVAPRKVEIIHVPSLNNDFLNLYSRYEGKGEKKKFFPTINFTTADLPVTRGKKKKKYSNLLLKLCFLYSLLSGGRLWKVRSTRAFFFFKLPFRTQWSGNCTPDSSVFNDWNLEKNK